MSQYVAILVLLSAMLMHITGMFIDTPRKHLHRHRGSKHYNLKGSGLHDLPLRSLHQNQNQDWWKWDDEMRDDFEDDRDTYQRPKRDHDRIPDYDIHVEKLQRNSRCKIVLHTDHVSDSNNTAFSIDLMQYKCQDTSNRCNAENRKCCMQMYTSINITFSSGKKEVKKILTGCVYTDPRIPSMTPQVNSVDM